ncbi:hypothetical protein K435DRAFT_790724 [Dendrothele bispora CBS 962.96]|uniref:Uncharacterized protein n=1 Tax=Dendrothele bispora (strain CBS 962.96) TaxID=1314807 RepID=A0A4S8MP82_DENBC|nr:hypothetical protein K435DRAFT_790724 [Dendrothele bispora CBS 962.96]
MHLGAGSRTSPIFISDDEDDALSPDIEIVSLPESPRLNTPPIPDQSRGRFTKQKAPTQAAKQQSLAETLSKKRKRKREPSNAQSLRQVSSQVTTSGSNKSKRLKQEKPSHLNLYRYDSSDVPYSGDPYMTSSMSSLPAHSFTNVVEDMPAQSAYYSFPSTDDHDDNDVGDSPLLSSSEWVNSMARAAKPPMQDTTYPSKCPPTYTSPPPQGYVLEQSPDPLPVEPRPSASTSASTIENTAVSNTSHSLPPSKKQTFNNIIGMPIERDVDGKHGSFRNTQYTTFDAQLGVKFPYVPNPSKTLIIEQLPKTHRTFSFIQSWCKDVCGTFPIFYAVEANAAKALVEFSSATLAKRAWGSPKLGKGLSGLNPTQLKGKPREDLIRVWWYRPPSPELVFARKELEEGEIEDDTIMGDSTPKETKKERKARLAKAQKEEKAKKREKALAAAATLQKEKAAKAKLQAQTAIHNASVPVSAHSLPNSYSADHYDPNLPVIIPPPMYMPVQPPTNPPPLLLNSWNISNGIPPFVPPIPSTLPPPLPPPLELHSQWNSRGQSHSRNIHVAESLDGRVPLDDDNDDGMDIEDLDMELSSPVGSILSQPPENADAVLMNSPSPSPKPLLPASLPSKPSTVLSSELHRGLPTPTPTPPNEQTTLNTLHTHKSLTQHPLSPVPSSSSITAPSEPRAMKNAPRQPSFTKRSLLARQRELEERISRSKLELERKGQLSSQVAPTQAEPVTVTMISSIAATPDEVDKVEASSKRELEEDLRQRVLASQKRRKAAVGVNVVSSPAPFQTNSTSVVLSTETSDHFMSTPEPNLTKASTSSSTESSAPGASTPTKSSLDDLALSFINETFQTLQPASPSAPLSPSSASSTLPPTASIPLQVPRPLSASSVPIPVKPSSNTSSLAAKRLQLEQNIAETKMLMDELSRASTKQERDGILSRIREISRNTSEIDKAPTPRPGSTPSPAPPPASVMAYPSFLTASAKSPWPDSIMDGGILILSDDEDEENADDNASDP